MNQETTALINDAFEIAQEVFRKQPNPIGDSRHMSFADAMNVAVGIQRNYIISNKYINIRTMTENLKSKGIKSSLSSE